MIVLDASAVVDWLLGTAAGRTIAQRIHSRSESLHAPHLLDIEVAQVLRRLVRESVISSQRADEALQDLWDIPLTRYPHHLMLDRVWQLRHNLSAYDAVYVILAAELRSPLITRDKRIAAGAGRSARVEVF